MSELFDITGNVAIITGASRGIGLAIARRFAEAGAKVVLSSRKQEALDTIAAEMQARGLEALPVAAHNGDKAALQALVGRTVDSFGRVDILVNNAATNPHFGPILDSADSMWQKTIEVNLMGNFWLTQACVPVMRGQGGGRIINVASVNGLRPGTFMGIYSLTKAALISLTQTLAVELASDHIQVNAIAPGLTRTQFAQALWDNDLIMERVNQRTPMQRIAEPDEMAGIALYLASPAASYVTGQVFVVDGGASVPLL